MSEILKPEAKAAAPVQMAHCIAVWCSSPKVLPGRPFCEVHWWRVPKHLRDCIHREYKWLARLKLEVDQHTIHLVLVAVNREFALRLLEDPATKARYDREQAEAVAAQKAREAGLILPATAGLQLVGPDGQVGR